MSIRFLWASEASPPVIQVIKSRSSTLSLLLSLSLSLSLSLALSLSHSLSVSPSVSLCVSLGKRHKNLERSVYTACSEQRRGLSQINASLRLIQARQWQVRYLDDLLSVTHETYELVQIHKESSTNLNMSNEETLSWNIDALCCCSACCNRCNSRIFGC